MPSSVFFTCLFLLVLFVQTIYTEKDTCTSSNCVEGRCVNGTCECDTGWAPPQCKHCTGIIRLQNAEGIISDGHGNYTEDNKCMWLVDTGQNRSLWFQFHQFSTECGWDHLYIYDGDSAFAPLLAAFSGLIHKDYTVTNELQEIQTTSGKAFLYFYSDAAYNMSGFNITYRTGGCPKNCSGQGDCSGDICTCHPGYRGKDCSGIICPNNCSQNGNCVNDQCQCFQDFKGEDCGLTSDKASWRQRFLHSDLLARMSSGAAVVGEDAFLVGGYSFKPLDFLVKYKMASGDLEVITPVSIENPAPRYGHSVVAYQNKLYMFGGVEENETSRDLWTYSTTAGTWSVQRYTSTVPMGVAGHTAHIIRGVMYVLFGYSPIYGYQNRIQEYNIANDSWTVPKTRGALVQGGYGHSSVYYPATDKIYIYGGYHARSTSNYDLTDQLYSFEPSTRIWIQLRSNQLPRYLHTAVIVDGMMIVYGGNTHNDTSISLGAKCYSPDLLLYDIDCNKWSQLDSSELNSHGARYGHSALTLNRNGGTEMVVVGGFSGIMEGNALLFSPGNCSYHASESECVGSVQGRSCVWRSGRCVALSDLDPSDSGGRSCDPSEGQEEICKSFKSCPTCLSTAFRCVWCGKTCVKHDNCTNSELMTPGSAVNLTECPYQTVKPCPEQHKCQGCNSFPDCQWGTDRCESVEDPDKNKSSADTFNDLDDLNKTSCRTPCYLRTDCENCTSSSCMWCSNQQKCVETNAYVATFIYGQCMEWTTDKAKCPSTRCADLHSCKDCQSNPLCGWCNDPSNTGIGRCVEGGASGPVNQTNHQITDLSICPISQWYFVDCPDCQCNGHSTCLNVTGECDSCQNMTEGKNCEECMYGYYGDSTNGGRCSPCQCNGQADSCDTKSGACFCRTRGVVGDNCDRCDEPHKYFGNPKTGTCYYNLVTDYQFTFNLSKKEDKPYTQINFMNIPSSSERDVDFKVNCSGVAYLNITMKKKSQGDRETIIVQKHSCNYFRAKFDHGEYSFGPQENTTFLVYVYGFQTPFWLQISFSQFAKIDLVHFFVTFFSCFLSLLIIAAVLYKIKHKYDNYRRRQRMMVEMEEMASRPFSSITVEIDRKYSQIGAEKKETELRKRKKTSSKPSQIACEPLHHQKAAVMSLIVQLPTGEDEWTPNGASGVAIASALVTVGHHRKQSLEHGGKGDKSKHKKVLFPGSQDVCV